MLTIRLMVGDAEAAHSQGVAARLRGVALEVSGDAAPMQPPDECAAIVFVEQVEPALVEQYLKAGKHVLLATEPRWTWNDLAALLQTARNAGVQLAVVNPDRYLPSRQLIRQQIEGPIGDVCLVRAHYWEPAKATGEHTPDPLGLPLALVRQLDVVTWLAGAAPNLVYALEQPAGEGIEPRARDVQVHIGFPEAMALVCYSNGLPAGGDYRSLSVIGTTGAAYADDHQNVQLVYRGGLPQGVRAEEEGVRQHVAIVQEFADAVNAGRDLSATVTAWQQVHSLVDAVNESIATRRAVAIGGPLA